MNINCNSSNKVREIKLKEREGVFLQFLGISVLGKLLIVSEEREAFPDHVAHHEGISVIPTARKACVGCEVLVECFIQQSQCSADDQCGHEGFIVMAQRGHGGRSWALARNQEQTVRKRTRPLVFCLFLHLVVVAGTATHPTEQPSH